VKDGAALAEESLRTTTNHAETLLPLLAGTLEKAGVTLNEVSGLGVSIGPGSFTGLRVALSTVKGLSYAAGQPVVGVPTLDALARTVCDREGLICPLLDARKAEVYVALFRRYGAGSVEKLSADLVLPPGEFLEQITEPCTFLGDGAERYADLIRERCPAEARVLPFASFHPRGSMIATMAWERLRRGEHDDLRSLVPAYVRPPEAVVKRAG
jgi:tRNA threonylcarbamoyladenosine biosynthesis protein TsaB